jgi:glucosamine--fructose-6-phosphate aminotransferase (isomerizing)
VKPLGNFPDPFLREVRGQPEAIRRAAAGLSEQQRSLEALLDRQGVPKAVVFTGMGSSYHACYPVVNELAARGVWASHVDAAELLHFRLRALGSDAVVVVVSQSGRSAEAVRLAEKILDRPSPPLLVSVSNGLRNPLVERASVSLDTRAGEEVGPSTMTFGASLVVLASVAQALTGDGVEDVVAAVTSTAEAASTEAQRLLDDPVGRAEELGTWLGRPASTVILGRGPARAAAETGALMLKEVAAYAAEALESAQFRHGPLELAGPSLAAIVLATEPETAELDMGMAREVAASGASVLVVSRGGEAPDGIRMESIGPLERSLSPAVSVIPIQLLAWQLARERGRRPGTLTRATKVTTRE